MRKLFGALLFFCCSVLMGQAPATGNYAFATVDAPQGFDSVNVGNLDVRFNIPIVSRTGRGLPFNYNLQYEGLVWFPSNTTGSLVWASDPSWGFQGVLNGTGYVGYLSRDISHPRCDTPGSSPPSSTLYSNFVYHDTFGGTHRFNYQYYAQACPGDDGGATGDGSTNDGSGYKLNVTNRSQVTTRSGYTFSPPPSVTSPSPSSLIDTNGNTISGTSTGVFKDTLGVNALTVSGSNPLTFTYPVTLQSNNATTAAATLTYQTYTVQPHFQCPNIGDPGAQSVPLPYRLTMADGTYYQFSYEATHDIPGSVTGRLAMITLPTGGTIQYQYSGGCGSAGAGINPDGSPGNLVRISSDGTRQYNRGISQGAYFTDVVDEKGNYSHYIFSAETTKNEFLETDRQIHQGSLSGPILMEQTTCYNGATACNGESITLPITASAVTTSYNGVSQAIAQNTFDGNGELLTQSTVSAGSTVQNIAQYSYSAQGLVTGVTQRNANNTAYAFEYYNYDEGTPTSTSGLPQHSAVSGPRNNLTSVHTSAGGYAGYLVRSTTYYDTGQPATSTAQDGGTTTYTYDGTQGFVINTAPPTPWSGQAMHTAAQYDTNSASLLYSTGLNGEQTKVNKYDARMRPIDVTLPSGSEVIITLDSSNFNHTVVTQTLDGSRTARGETLLDGYGRLSRTIVANGQSSNGWYQVDYCYDASGLLQFQSSPYQSTGFLAANGQATAKHCSGSGTSYVYDALGRVTSTTNDDGTASTSYNGRAVKTTDVNGVAKITQYDVLGRISSVCEVSGTNYGGQSTSACGTDISGTGYLTSYNYGFDSAYPRTTITQGGQTRYFETDNAGRTIFASEPERGATNYAYTFRSGVGLTVTRTRPKANQTNASTMTTTTSQYDYFGRLAAVTYDDGTPWKNWWYDTRPANLGWTTTPSNGNGKLVAMTTSVNGTTPITGAQFSYDAAGNVLTMWQCAPSICGGSNQQSRGTESYTYDQSGAVMSAYDGASGTIAYTRSIAGEVTSVTNQNYAPSNTVSSVVNGPFGPTSWALGNGLSGVNSYDTLGRVNGSFACQGSTQPSCTGGTKTYSDTVVWKGARVTSQSDSVVPGGATTYGYDDLNRLTGAQSGSTTLYSYGYDRYGNRVAANGVGYSFNAVNQQTNNSYDAAGNQISDASHSYTYDAEGKILQVDGGTTAKYVYDALDHRVRATTSGSDTEYSYDPLGRRQSSWVVSNNSGNGGRIYWDRGLIANRSQNGGTYFHHLNYLGTDRMRTNPSGQSASTQSSGPFGENFTQNVTDSGGSQDNNQYTSQDRDGETNTEHFQYRQYSEMSGRWLSPDPYDGSYDVADPQSYNRYAYALASPLSYTDPFGLKECTVELQLRGDCDPGSTPPPPPPPPVTPPVNGGGPQGPGYNGGVPVVNSNSNGDPCANKDLHDSGVNIHQQIAVVNDATRSKNSVKNPVTGFINALFNFAELVQTGGPYDYKNQPGPGTPQQRVDAGNVAYGVSCPFGNLFCQAAAGINQLYRGDGGPASTFFDSPRDNAMIKQGQAMKAAGCHS